MTEQQADLLTKLYAAIYTARCSRGTQFARIQAQREIDDLCKQHRFLADERARKVREHQRTQVAVAQRARRGEPLFPVKVTKENGRLRKFGPTMPSGRAPRQATNARRRGSCRSTAPTRAGPDDSDGDPEPPGQRLAPGAWRQHQGAAL